MRCLGQIEHVLHGVELHHVGVVLFAVGDQLCSAFFEFVGHKFQEDQAEHDVFVFYRKSENAKRLVQR